MFRISFFPYKYPDIIRNTGTPMENKTPSAEEPRNIGA
jgi:hypothetical protein